MSKGTTRTKKRYLRGAADHWRTAVRLQQARLESDAMDTKIDLDFFNVAVFRLCNVAKQAINHPGSEGVRDVLEAFYSRWPDFKPLRNQQEHITGPHLRPVLYFQRDMVELLPGGQLKYLTDAEDMEPDVESLYQALCEFLGDP